MPLILIVEDDDVLLGLISSILKREGYEVRHAASGPAALEILEKERCDLVLTDFEMRPMNGLQMVHRIAQRSPDIGILFMSGFPAVAHAVQEEFGPDSLVVKPFAVPELLRKIKKSLNRRLRKPHPDGHAN
jgi:two-component system cell cycle response regulator CpdR